MNNKCILAAIVAALACASALAAEVAFTGGAGGTSRDLSLADNWDGGSLPSGVGATGVVNVATFGTSYTVSSAAALDGLKFDNASSKVTIGGEGVLSLGAGGLALSGTGGISLNASMAVTAASTWDMGGGPLECRTTVSGTADLTWRNYSAAHLYTAPGYGGKMTMIEAKERSYVHVYQGAAWANTVVVKGGIVYRFDGRVLFSTMIPGRSLSIDSWIDISFLGTGTLVFEDGDTFSTKGDFHQVAQGGLEVSGGTYNAGAMFIMGGQSGTGTTLTYAPSSVLVSGGGFEVNQFNLGLRAETNRLFRQTGGTVTACSYHIGGSESIKGTVPVMEYRLEGGTMTDKSGNSQDRGLVMGGMVSSANRMSPPGVFTMTGGTANFNSVRWGAKGGQWAWDGASTFPNGRAYGLLDLRGGSFRIPSGGFELAPMWNSGTVSNSAYDVRLSGGTVANAGSSTMMLAMTIGAGEDPSTWNTGANNVLVSAPVDGDGVLRKTGAGTLQFADATRFGGSVKVEEGTLEVRGTVDAPSGYTEGENLRIFSADSLAGTFAEDDAVTSWSDSTGTLSCQKPTSSEISSPDTYSLPTFKANVANGHAGVYFNKGHVLGFHPADNPLAGETNFSFAVVFRPTGQGDAGDGNAYASSCIIGNDRNWSGYGPNNISLLYTLNAHVALYVLNKTAGGDRGNRVYMVPNLYQGYTEGVNNTSVAVVSMRGNKIVYNFNNCFTNRTFEAIADNFNPRFMDGNTKYPLYFGTSDVDGNSRQQARCFGGYIFEVRFYKGRALTAAETRSVMDELTRKYHGASRAEGYLKASNGSIASSVADSREAPEARAVDVEWTPEFMDQTFSAWDANYNKPELVLNACNGRSALRFDAARNTVLKIPSGANQDPLSEKSQFAIAFVFRTKMEGEGLADGSTGIGIYSSMLPNYGHNSGCANSAITFREYGAVGGYMATNHDGGSLVNSRKPCHLNDGLPHVAVFTADSRQESKTYRLMVDGVYTENQLGYGTAWAGYDSSRPHVIGALRAGVGHFTGDIMGFKFYNATLTEAEMFAICQKAAYDYGFNLKERRAFALSDLEARGISATNYTVSAGATLRMPLSATAPFTVGAGVTLRGEGAFEGSYRFCDGGVVDFATLPADMEDVQIADGARVVVGEGMLSAPVDGSNISSISGNVVFDVSGVLDRLPMRSRLPILAISPDAIAPGATFSVSGGTWDMSVQYDAGKGCLVLCRQMGCSIIVF